MFGYDTMSLQWFFFEAAAETYASGKKAESCSSLVGGKVFRYERGEFSYRDTYVANGEWSGGQTLICIGDIPVWMMQYHGWCRDDSKEVSTILKKALLATYTAKEFSGCRGPNKFADGDSKLVYENFPQTPPYKWRFENFQGRERIWRRPDNLTDLFWHRYQGLLLRNV